ncbi:OLC1v1003857C1 [Oldenlandia corymbosa var. corymbosa]|uniref:OLC1v1003857C1 n=1 Tax=Oldenlandia corymbosa var. corymbosa TaxID=529605 RepID=A0AAV1DDN8_OLDCO|nr:OLC1v1003857C1 [Oldenlandia corymbosa var. corymbosa]
MANFILFSLLIVSLPFLATAAPCGGSCGDLNDCDGQLICINGKCNDDPDIGTHTCGTPSGPSGGGGGGSGSMSAVLTLNDFSEGGDGGGPSECDGRYHANTERVVALSTRWYAGGSRCGKMIRITARNGRTTTAKVVDECDSNDGCENNIVDGSDAVWKALGLNEDLGRVPVSWSMA